MARNTRGIEVQRHSDSAACMHERVSDEQQVAVLQVTCQEYYKERFKAARSAWDNAWLEFLKNLM